MTAGARPGTWATDVDWLIVGGGIHGVHLAARLLGEAGVTPDALRIVDPGPALLARWQACTRATGMRHLRSPSVHHLDLEPFSLQHFAGKRGRRPPDLFIPPYDRPSLDLFDAHCARVIETHGLGALHISAKVVRLEPRDGVVHAELSSGERIVAGAVLLAIGASEQPDWPAWAPRGTARVGHLFDLAPLPWPDTTRPETIAVVGGGISAAQVALRLVAEGHTVTLVSRHALREHPFDSDPGWLGPRFMTRFEAEPSFSRRRAMIRNARHRGSMPPDVRRAIATALDERTLALAEADVIGLEVGPSGCTLSLGDGSGLGADRVLLATGFATTRPGGEMLDTLIAESGLPCAECGFPMTDRALRWHPSIFVTGPLAELELGPVARNIAGARRAGDRIVEVVGLRRSA